MAYGLKARKVSRPEAVSRAEEALAISNRIAVMREGCILQAGSPEELCRRPNCPFVARFVGSSLPASGGRESQGSSASLPADLG